MNKGVAVIAIILLVVSASIPAIALSEQLEERGLNNTGNTTMPDLLVKDITISSPVYQNETAQINATIRNNGTNASQFNITFLVNGTLKGEKTIEALNENENAIISFDWMSDETGNYSLKIVADSNDEVTESNETNNELGIEISVLMRITIVIKDSSEKIHVQDLSLKANVSILNATAIACEKQNITFDLNDGNITIDGLDNPKVFLYNKKSEKWNETGIDHELKDLDIIGWSGEDDLPLMLPDITPENITVVSFGGTLYTNVTNEIEVNIRNKGLVNASNFTSVFKVNDKSVAEIEIESLNRMEEKTNSFNWIPDHTGNYTLSVEVDPQNNISESNETNNNISIGNVTVRAVSIITVPTDYLTIQEAIDAAPPGSRIFIEDGEYPINDNEHAIRIENKNLLWIIGDVDVKLIASSGGLSDLITIKSSEQITLSGFTVGVEKSAQNKKRNIVIEDSNEITLSNLTLYNYATEGASFEHIPITISNASNCEIEGCKFTTRDGSAYGLIIGSKSRGNIIENNTFSSDMNSIFMGNTTNNILCNNTIHGIMVGGEDIYSWPVVEYYSDNNTIHNNEIYSISMQGDNNTIYNNTIISLGMNPYPFDGNNNTIYLNNIFGFGDAGVQGNSNNWNSTIPVNYTYNGSEYTNYTGNFWYDYSGVDNNSDGIGDMPYKVCDGNYDYYPLTEPFGLTFDLAVTAITRPYITYADRENTILVTIERTGTYLAPEDECVNLSVNDSEVESKAVRIGQGQNVVKFVWTPPDVGDYRLSIELHPKDTLISEMNDTNNGFSIDVTVSPPPLFNYGENISSALEFLNGEQLATGGIWGFENSGRAALAIVAAGEDPSTGRWKPSGRDSSSLIEYLRKEPKYLADFLPPGANPPCLNMPEDFARMVMVISAVGKDPTNFGDVNYLTMLKSYYDGEQFGDPDSIEDDAFVILALVSSGDEEQRTKDMITKATRYIKRQNETDGGWGQFGGGSNVKTTSLAIQALIAAGEDEEPQVVENALKYLKNAQDDDGGYSDVKATSYAIQAFIAAGEYPSNYNKTIDYLLSLQQADGSFNYTAKFSLFPPVTTTFPILALRGEPYPVMFKTMREDYELPDTSVSSIVTEDEICVNTTYTIKTDIKSNGGIFYVDLLSDGEFVGRKRVHSVWYDSLTPISFSWRTNTTGDHNLTVFADSMNNNNITESDEDNNNATKQVTVVYPDLYPSDITPPDNVYVNVTNVIDCTIEGTNDEHFNVSLEADGKPVGEQRIEGIRDNLSLSFDWRPSANRTYNLRFTVDSDAEMRERDADNNTLSKSVDVLLPDLVPTSITAGEIFVNARNKVNLTVEGFAENFNISLIENGTVVGKTANVTCYGTENVTVYWKPTALGNHTITAFVDSDGAIVETNEANNNITDTFEVLLPDLVPEAITPDVLYIDEVNVITVKVNGTAERFNATLVAEEIVDRSGPLRYVITPVFNGSEGTGETFSGTVTDSNLTYNITEQRTVWSWKDIDTLSVIIVSNTSTGLVDNRDTWSVDYVAVVVNYTLNSTNQTLELNASEIVSGGNWSNGNNTYISDDEYATAAESTTLQLDIMDTDAIYGNITSVAIKVEQHVIDAVPSKKDTAQKKTNIDTYNGSIGFEWLPMKLGEYKLTVFMDSDSDTEETNETNNNMTKSVVVANRIDVELTSPLGGELWEGIQNITWNASYENPLLIDIFYSPDRGYRWIDIATNETNDGVYEWNTGEEEAPADPIDGEYMIKIVARAGEVTAEDKSDIFYIRNNKAGVEWGSFHHNAGYAPCDGPDSSEIAWMSEDIGACGSSSLIVAGGKVFVYCTGEHGAMTSPYPYTYLVALDESNGEVLWATRIAPQEYGSWATPAYKDGSVFVSSGKGVYRIDADDGDIEWEFRFPTGEGSVNGGPAVTSRAVYAGDWNGSHYYCIKNNRTSPKELWNFSVEGRAQATPAIAYGNVYFGSFCGGECQSKAFCVDAVNGTETWSTPTGDVCGSLTVADGLVYFTTYGGGVFYALDAFNGSLIWKRHGGWSDSTPAYYSPPRSTSTRSYIYVVIVHGFVEPAELHCFDAKTGEEIWRTGGNSGYWTASPIVTRDGKVFVGNSSVLSCLDAFTGNVIWQSNGGPSPVVVSGFVYTVNGGRVIAYGNGTMPDLIVEAEAPDSEYVVDKEGNITATIKNIGKGNVTKSFKVELRYQGDLENPIAEQTISPPLNINDSMDVKFEWIPEEWSTKEKTKEYLLKVEVDPPPGNVSESNPWNNIANVTVNVSDNKPDLVTTIEKVLPKHAYVGDTVTVKANITNIGYETDESFRLRFSVDDIEENMNVEENMTMISLEDNVRLNLDFKWNTRDNGTYNLTVDANPSDRWTIYEVTWTNNKDSVETEVMPAPTPTPTSITEKPGFGPGSGGGFGGGTAGGIGEGSGTGEAGAGEAGGMQIPVNESGSASETKKEVRGFPFGNATSGAPGGGGTLPILLILLAILAIALFYFGYYKEKRAYRGNKK